MRRNNGHGRRMWNVPFALSLVALLIGVLAVGVWLSRQSREGLSLTQPLPPTEAYVIYVHDGGQARYADNTWASFVYQYGEALPIGGVTARHYDVRQLPADLQSSVTQVPDVLFVDKTGGDAPRITRYTDVNSDLSLATAASILQFVRENGWGPLDVVG